MATLSAVARGRRPGVVLISGAGVAFQINLRALSFVGLAVILLALLSVWAMTLGSFQIAFGDVIEAVLGSGTQQHEFIVRTLRMPRVLVAIMAGAALAMSGGIFQGLVRNPLVSPDIIGIDAGATVVAVAWILNGQDLRWLPLVAFGGAICAAALIYGLTWRGGISGNRMILVGVGVSAVLSAITTFLMLRYPIERVSSAVLWTTGSVYNSDWQDVRVLGVSLLILAPLTIILMWPLRILQYGDDTAAGLGMSVERSRLLLMAAGCGLAATAVSIVGPVGFVAFMTPHIARMLAGPMTGTVMLLSGLIGAIFLLGADIVGQHFLPVPLPVGVVTGVIGAPYFLFLLYRVNARL